MFSKFIAGAVIVGTFLFAAAFASAHTSALPGEKLDSGLGEMPHYSKWPQHPELSHLVVGAPGMAAPAHVAAAR